MAPKKVSATAGLEAKEELKAVLLADSFAQVKLSYLVHFAQAASMASEELPAVGTIYQICYSRTFGQSHWKSPRCSCPWQTCRSLIMPWSGLRRTKLKRYVLCSSQAKCSAVHNFERLFSSSIYPAIGCNGRTSPCSLCPNVLVLHIITTISAFDAMHIFPILQVFVICCAHAEQVKQHILGSKWGSQKTFKVDPY